MKKIEQLLEHAHNNESQKFKDVFNSLRNSLNVWEDEGGTHAEAIAFIGGNLIEQYTDLLTVVGYYWKTHLTEDTLKSHSSSKHLNNVLRTFPIVLGSVQQHYGWEQVVEVSQLWMDAADPASESALPQSIVTKVFVKALGKMRTNWSENPETFKKMVDLGGVGKEGLVVMAVRHGNDQLLSYIAQTQSLEHKEAVFVIAEWSEKLAELMPVINADPTVSRRENAMRMFPIAAPFATVDQIIQFARRGDSDKEANLGHLREFIQQLDKWDGQTPFSPSDRWVQQIDLILENCETSPTTPNEDLVDKLVKVSGDKYPNAQHWRNTINRHKMLQEVGHGSQISTRKM